MGAIVFFCFFLGLTSATPNVLQSLNATLPKSKNITDSVNYRLPKTAEPISQVIDLTLDSLDSSTTGFQGVTEITFTVIDQIKEIRIHGNGINITMLKLLNADTEISTNYEDFDEITNILTITTMIILNPDVMYTLKIAFEAKLYEKEMEGFYKSTYTELDDKGVKTTKYLATTQFESINARKAFPCFDEPEFKPTFTLSITVPSGFHVQSNTQPSSEVPTQGKTKFTFLQTPPMPAYLLAFTVSEFTSDNGIVDDSIPYKVWSRKEEASKRKLALEYGPKLLSTLEDIFNIKYESSGIGKLDLVAIPDFSAGAMENWGHITFREMGLLYDNETTPNLNKQKIIMVITHELTHMWFGNLVTMNWWNNIFLNEGFARYYQYFATAKIVTNWDLDKQFTIRSLHRALIADASESSLALSSSDILTPDQIVEKFDSISYDKGASIIRMFVHLMGEDNFNKGLRHYLDLYSFANSEPDNLWRELNTYYKVTDSDAPSLITAVQNWTVKAGYPLLSVSTDGDNVIISQKRFLLSGKSDTEWYIPITYRTSKENDFSITTPTNWLKPGGSLTLNNVLNGVDWLVLNTQQTGFYRVHYDDNLWKKLLNVLNNDHEKINVLNRAQIIDDTLNLAQAGVIKYRRFMELVEYMKNETDYYPWYAMLNGLSDLIDKIENKYLREEIRIHFSRLIAKVFDSTPIENLQEDDQIYTLKQVLLFHWATRLSVPETNEKADKLFKAYKINNEKPNKNLKLIVCCSAIRQSNDKTDFNFLWDKFIESNDAMEKVLILQSLGCSQNVDLLKIYLDKAFSSNSDIRQQDLDTAVQSLYANNNRIGLEVLLNYTLENYEKVKNRYGSSTKIISFIKTMAGKFNQQSDYVQIKTLIEKDGVDDDVGAVVEKLIEKSVMHLKGVEILESQLAEYFKEIASNGNKININPYNLFISIFITMLFVINK